MKYEYRKVKSLPAILFTMLLHGWWKIDGVKTQQGKFLVTGISDLFGKGYWSINKFALCGKILKGYWVDSLFQTDVWLFQRMFLSKKTYEPKSYKRENGITIYSMKEVKKEGEQQP